MFHPYRKDSSYLRTAMFKSYKEKCAYCGRTIQQRDMHIDHIIPSNQRGITDNEVRKYIIDLNKNGFVVDSIENYLPSCPACNIGKSNQIFTASNLQMCIRDRFPCLCSEKWPVGKCRLYCAKSDC